MASTLRRIFRYKSTFNQCLNHYGRHEPNINCRSFKTSSQRQKQGGSKLKLVLLATAAGVGAGAAYTLSTPKEKPIAVLNPVNENSAILLEHFPEVKISRSVKYPGDSSGLKLTLFQYTTCPFCCKVRAFLDYYGISYDVVEVNPVFRQQLKWTDYRKVPILLVEIGDKYLQLNDSTMIISALTSYLHDKDVALPEVANNYPTILYRDDDGTLKKEILNRYFLMYHGNIPTDSSKETILEERKWRKWADDVLVHMLSPNVYRSTKEALQAFNWFSEVGDWKSNFSSTETNLVVYIGAFAMWMIGKRLKKRHHLKEDVRVSLYDETRVWLREVRARGGPFHGGASPDLADLAVFGVLSSIEGCSAFADLLSNTSLSRWYLPMKEKVESHSGALLHASTH